MAFYVRIYILITHYLLYFRKVSSKGFKQHFAKCSSSVTALKSQQATISIPCVHSPYFKLLVFKCNSSVSNRMVPKIRRTILRVYFCYLLFMSLYIHVFVCGSMCAWLCMNGYACGVQKSASHPLKTGSLTPSTAYIHGSTNTSSP